MTIEQPKLTKVIINNITVRDDSDTGVTAYVLRWTITRNFLQGVDEVTIVLAKSVENVLTLDDDNLVLDVSIQRGATTSTDEYVFRGQVLGITEDGATFIVSGKDKLYNAISTEKTKTYDINVDTEAGVISEIFSNLINGVTSLTADNTSVIDSGTVNTLNKFVCNHAEVYERCEELAKTLNWQFFYNANTDLVYFEPKGYVTSTITLTVGNNVVRMPEWKYNAEKLVNKIYIIGAEQAVESTEYFDGDATETTFTILKTPFSVRVWSGSGDYSLTTGSFITFPHSAEANLKTGGKSGSTSGTYDYAVDEDLKQVIFEAASIPGSGTNNIEVNYSHMLPAPVVASDNVSINKYGLQEKTIFKDELKTIEDAEEFAKTQINKYSTPFVFTKLRVTNTTGLNPGELVRCVDAHNNVDRWLLITQMILSYPYRFDELTVGDEIYKTAEWEKDTDIRVRRLEEKAGKSTDLLLHIISLDRTYKYDRRDIRVYKKTYDAGDEVFILDHPVHGILDTSTLGAGGGTAESIVKINPGNMIFEEYLYDTEYLDTSVSTATIDVITNEVVFQ